MVRWKTALFCALWLAPVAAGCNSIFGISSGVPGTGGGATTTSGTTSTTGTTTTTHTASTTSTTTTTSTAGTGGAGGSSGTGGTGGSITLPLSWMLSGNVGPGDVPDASAPFETDTVSVTRAPAAKNFVLASTSDGTGTLYVDDNVHVVVTPQGGTSKDQYFEFWAGYPCPAASMDVPPGGNGSGSSPPIDITALFSTSTSQPQEVRLEFWHCASHIPSPHSAFYLVEL